MVATIARPPVHSAAGTTPPATPSGQPAQVPTVPFTRAARMQSQLAFDTGVVALGAAQLNLGPIELPPAGYLSYLELEVTIAGANGGGAATAFNPDAPFNALALVSFANTAGDTNIVPMDGYKLAMIQKYGAFTAGSASDDPRRDQQFSVTTGAGATGGSAKFFLRIPQEVSKRDAFCSLANGAGNKLFRLTLLANTLAAIYSVAPSAGATIHVVGTMWFWSTPLAQTSGGVPQQVAPNGNGSVQYWRLDTPTIGAGDKLVKISNVGNVMRMIIFILRNAAGARVAVDWPGTCFFRLDNDDMFFLPVDNWQSGMSRAYGLQTGAIDTAGGLDTGVFVLYQWLTTMGHVTNWGTRDQWLPTLDTTLCQLRGTSFGAAASTLEILTNEIKPTSGLALYGY